MIVRRRVCGPERLGLQSSSQQAVQRLDLHKSLVIHHINLNVEFYRDLLVEPREPRLSAVRAGAEEGPRFTGEGGEWE